MGLFDFFKKKDARRKCSFCGKALLPSDPGHIAFNRLQCIDCYNKRSSPAKSQKQKCCVCLNEIVNSNDVRISEGKTYCYKCYLKQRLLSDTKSRGPSIFIKIETWDYMLTNIGTIGFELWHHVTPEDGGYGTEVRLNFPADYFKTHTVEDLYNSPTSMHMRPTPNSFNREKEIETLKNALKSLGWL